MPHPHGRTNVLHVVFAHIYEGRIDAVAHGFEDNARNTNTSGFGDGFDPGGNVHAFTVDVGAVVDHLRGLGATDVEEVDGIPETIEFTLPLQLRS